MPPDALYLPGDSIVIRNVRGAQVRAVSPALVVEHSPDLLVTWIPLGSPLLLPGDAQGRPTKSEGVDRMVEVKWNSWGGPLFIWPQGAWHSVRASWSSDEPDRVLDHWYVNLHTPLRRSAIGFDIEDLVLDVIVKADRSSWEWKDEQEFERECASGHVDAETAQTVRATGAGAAASALSGKAPFTSKWETWRPDPTWLLPTLPAGALSL